MACRFNDRQPRLGRRRSTLLPDGRARRFTGVVGSPAARDVSLMPYQEEPRDVPVRWSWTYRPRRAKSSYIPIVIAGGTEGREKRRRFTTACSKSAQRSMKKTSRTTSGCKTRPRRRNAGRTIQHGFHVGEDRSRQRSGDESSARHGAGRGFPHLWRERAAGLRLVLRPRRAVDFSGHQLLRRFCGHAHGARISKKVPARRRQNPARDFAERRLIPWFTDYPYPGRAQTRRRCTSSLKRTTGARAATWSF